MHISISSVHIQVGQVQLSSQLSGPYTYAISVHNTGFGAVLSPRRVYLLLKARSTTTTATTQQPTQVDLYTKASTGGKCYFDPSRTDCAICQNGGCACHEKHKGQCIKCGGGDGVCGVPREEAKVVAPTGPAVYYDTGVDVRAWGPGKTHRVEGSVNIPTGK